MLNYPPNAFPASPSRVVRGQYTTPRTGCCSVIAPASRRDHRGKVAVVDLTARRWPA